MDPQQALNYHPDLEELGDDGLGWYEDGVKRTLTDEQIEMFRHTELEELNRNYRLEAEAREDEEEMDEDDDYEPTLPTVSPAPASIPRSPISEASSLEDELSMKANATKSKRPQPKKTYRQASRSQTPNSHQRLRSPRPHQRKKEIPYDQRNKRKWENYIDGKDPVHGSMTHRRLVRELDEQRTESVAIDYGDDEPAPPPLPPNRLAAEAARARKVISYEDD